MSKWAEGLVSVAAELARWRSGGRTPARSSSSHASTKRSCWARTVGCCGASAQARCDQTPVTSTAPSAHAAATRCTISDQSVRMPPRPSPVSTFTWTRAGRPRSCAAATTASSVQPLPTVTSMSASIAPATSAPGTKSQVRRGAVTPAARSSRASVSWATPSQVAPPSSAARAEGTRPWP